MNKQTTVSFPNELVGDCQMRLPEGPWGCNRATQSGRIGPRASLGARSLGTPKNHKIGLLEPWLDKSPVLNPFFLRINGCRQNYRGQNVQKHEKLVFYCLGEPNLVFLPFSDWHETPPERCASSSCAGCTDCRLWRASCGRVMTVSLERARA